MSEYTSGSREEYGRSLPHDNVAEQSVLGGMLLSKDAIADVVEVLRGVDFYKPAHESVYDAVISLYGRGEPADAITVGDELTKRGEIERIGGVAYLHSLIASVPTAANAGFYAEIVRERAVLRRLVEAGTKIAQLGYSQDGEVDDIVNEAQGEIYQVAERRTSEDYVVLSEVMESAVDEIEAAGNREGMQGVPTGFIELDELTHGFQGGQMIVIAARPAMGKSTFALDIARSASIKHNMTSVIFSLEMSRNEIAMRLLSAEGTLQMQDLRAGTLQDEQWAKIAQIMGKMDSAPLFIDDSPNMSLMEIRAKCRRLKQKHDLKLVVLDYLQLMSSGKKVESRQQEVSEFSRALKLLAKELEVPVIALSQLNRGSEQRTDKKPQVSDLRESGCLTGDTRILRADTGAETTMRDLYESGEKDVPVWALADDLRYVQRPMTHVFSTGVKPVYRLRLASGREVRATANHKFFTYSGWRALGDLGVGDRLGIPRHVGAPTSSMAMGDAEVSALGARLAGLSTVPASVFGLPKDQVRLLLSSAWSSSGSVSEAGSAECGEISLTTTTSRAAANAVARLLLRFGIVGAVSCSNDSAAASSAVSIDEFEDQLMFLEQIPVNGESAVAAAQLRSALRAAKAEKAAPGSSGMYNAWDEVRGLLENRVSVGDDSSLSAVANGGTVTMTRPPQSRLEEVISALDTHDLDMMAMNDLYWDRIVSIEEDGVEEVFDATVVGAHNFVANGVTVHNSIEQDADMVILLHREDVYDKESPRAGEADVIVAKHRNGPTKTIVVAFQGHYSRFANMALEGF
ncbi:replicative DNA helicase [Kocuria sp. WRN011]|uniref:Replicative DNA helicase n=1 Tax=Kocuria carniphila TaxID=262208 RepID=A0ABV3V1Z4_9MICC|nr:MULTISPECIES: replicative DNA helicase [Kocuria]MCT1801828.1 replicative DNA helicase [Kocuria carniphila]PBB09049.1 replicative DNA helicase [Kocuria sp. WRN011]PZP31119.1 MAG: replicative DNA helicase [Kocuria rhizophila]